MARFRERSRAAGFSRDNFDFRREKGWCGRVVHVIRFADSRKRRPIDKASQSIATRGSQQSPPLKGCRQPTNMPQDEWRKLATISSTAKWAVFWMQMISVTPSRWLACSPMDYWKLEPTLLTQGNRALSVEVSCLVNDGIRTVRIDCNSLLSLSK